jgi:hypothetical protein
VPLCPPQIPHWLTQDRTRASALRGRRLTAWDMVRPCNAILLLVEISVFIIFHIYSCQH